MGHIAECQEVGEKNEREIGLCSQTCRHTQSNKQTNMLSYPLLYIYTPFP